MVQHAEAFCRSGVNQIGGKHQFLGAVYANCFRQKIQAAAVGYQANLGKALRKTGSISGIYQIAGQHQINACTGRNAVNHGNKRFVNSCNAFGNRAHFNNKGTAGTGIGQCFQKRQVAACAKGLAAAGKHYAAYFFILLCPVKSFVQTVNKLVIHGVQAFRAVQRNGCYMVFNTKQNCFFHIFSLLWHTTTAVIYVLFSVRPVKTRF